MSEHSGVCEMACELFDVDPDEICSGECVEDVPVAADPVGAE